MCGGSCHGGTWFSCCGSCRSQPPLDPRFCIDTYRIRPPFCLWWRCETCRSPHSLCLYCQFGPVCCYLNLCFVDHHLFRAYPEYGLPNFFPLVSTWLTLLPILNVPYYHFKQLIANTFVINRVAKEGKVFWRLKQTLEDYGIRGKAWKF